MHFKALRWRSLSTRLTLFTLVIFVLSIWSLAFYASRTLHDDMKGLLGAQQFTTVSFVAEGIGDELKDRFTALESVAAGLGPALLADTASLQALLEARPALQSLFNGGVMAYRPDGTAIAEVPLAAARVGVNYMEIDTVAAALKEGKATVGQPVMGKKLNAPVFGMTVPVRDARGQVIGALAGVVNLGKPNFLDRIGEGRYGTTGGYLLIAPKSRVVITASDKSRIMEKLPPAGVNPVIDRFLKGDEGSVVMVNPHGVEVLAADKGIPLAGWIVSIVLPTAEAFAPIHRMQQRMLVAAVALTLLAGGLTWWMLRRQLAPVRAAARTLATFSRHDQPVHALPITHHDEIGELIGGFNRLLETVGQRERALRESEARYQRAVNGANDGIWEWIPATGEDYLSPRWKQLLGYEDHELPNVADSFFQRIHPDDVDMVTHAAQAHFEERKPYGVELRLRCKSGVYRWFYSRGQATWDEQGQPLLLAGSITDITERKQAQEALKESYYALRSILETTLDGFWCLDSRGQLIDVNPAYCRLSGYSRDELIGMRIADLEAKESVGETLAHVDQLVASGSGQFESLHRRKDGSSWQVEISTTYRNVAGGQFFVFLRDITERKQAQEALESTLKEKVALLNEVHHRVKNNLQVVASLLRLEAGRSSQGDTRTVLVDMQGRIRAMALLHETLYRSGIFASVELGGYLKQLATQTFRALASGVGAVQLQLELAAVQVSMDLATPCGLLVNELISNCLKHGFPNGRSGEVRLTLHTVAAQAIAHSAESGATVVRLSVSDTGVGLPADFETIRGQSLGLQLVGDLSQQIGGVLEIGPGPGSYFSITFAADLAGETSGPGRPK